MALTQTQLQQLAAQVGFPNPALAAAVAMVESGGNPSATNIVTAAQAPAKGQLPERSFGLFQINTLAHPQYNETSLLDPTYNAQAAFAISSQGTNWSAWGPDFTSGKVSRYYSGPLGPAPSLGQWTGALLILAAGAAAVYVVEKGVPRPLRRLFQ